MSEPNNAVDLSQLTLQQINEHIIEQVRIAMLAKNNIDALKGELARRLSHQARNLFVAKSKEHGEITFEEGGQKFKAAIERKVKWDSSQLQKIASTLPWSSVERLFKIDFSVSETTFKAILDDELRAKLEAARTTETGELKITPVTNKD